MQASAELKDLMLRWYDSFSVGDIDVTEGILSHDPALSFIGTDPAEWVVGYEAIFQGFKMQTEAMGGIQIEAGDLMAYSEGNVGWVVDRPQIKLPDGTVFVMRSSLIFHWEDEAWKLVHQHNSMGVSNEALVGQELPI